MSIRSLGYMVIGSDLLDPWDLRPVWLGCPDHRPRHLAPARDHDGPSYWGHERFHLPDDARARMRALAIDAAARGMRAPDPDPGPLPTTGCAWAHSWADRVIYQDRPTGTSATGGASSDT